MFKPMEYGDINELNDRQQELISIGLWYPELYCLGYIDELNKCVLIIQGPA